MEISSVMLYDRSLNTSRQEFISCNRAGWIKFIHSEQDSLLTPKRTPDQGIVCICLLWAIVFDSIVLATLPLPGQFLQFTQLFSPAWLKKNFLF